MNNAPASGVTAIASYPVIAANNGASSGSPYPVVVQFPAPGSYAYEFDYRSGTGGALSLSDGVRPLNTLVLSYTGPVQPRTGQAATFSVLAKDETGNPAASLPVTLAVSGANPQNLTATTNTSGIATFSYAGAVVGADVAQVTASVNGQGAISNQAALSWIATNAPSISVTGTSTLQLPNAGNYVATVTDPSGGGGGAITVAWTSVSGPGTVSFDAPTQTTTQALFSAPGNYVLQITATDQLGSNALQIPVTVQPPVNTEQGWIASPIDSSLVTVPIPPVTGLVPITLVSTETLVSGTLSYYPLSNPNAVVTLNANTTTAAGGTIATLDTTLLANGSYYILLNATDTTGKTMGSGVNIVVGGSYKPGRVTTTVTDLVVPAPGLPIQISRTYDSLVRGTSSDFGYGWSLGINLQMEVDSNNDVTFTLNGQRKTFYFTPSGSVLDIFTPAYTAEPGFFGTLVSNTSNCGTGISNQLVKTGAIYVCAIGYNVYQPSSFVYTDPYGRQYTVGGTGSLQQVKDLAGNTLTVTAAGISASNTLSVPFLRDGQGRITQITDPLGNVYAYGYDAAGNLASVTYPGIATPAKYTYDPTHLYTGGTDPRGNALPATVYDSSGRLQSVTDALGQKTSYAYNTATNTTTVTNPADASGNVGTVTTVYDGYGMPVSMSDPLGLTTTYTYDTSHNQTSVTDPLGHKTSFTYDSNGNQTSKTYPVTSTSVNTTSHTTYNAASEPTQTIDELGNTRTFTYDSSFWPKLATDSIGPVASFTFNTNGTQQQAKAVGYDLTSNQRPPRRSTPTTSTAI